MKMKRLLTLCLLLTLGFPWGSAGQQEAPLRICLISGSVEYESDVSLTQFQVHLEKNFNVECTLLKAQGRLTRRGEHDTLPGLEALEASDVAVFFTRRVTIEGEQLEQIKKYCLAGRPLVAVRTASHGFQNWLEFDREVLGGNYQGHEPSATTPVTYHPVMAQFHPVLDGVSVFRSPYTLYKTSPLAEDAKLLMEGTSQGKAEGKSGGGREPAVWTRTYKGARVLYTAMGGREDFENPVFLRLLTNAVFWTARREVDRKREVEKK